MQEATLAITDESLDNWLEFEVQDMGHDLVGVVDRRPRPCTLKVPSSASVPVSFFGIRTEEPALKSHIPTQSSSDPRSATSASAELADPLPKRVLKGWHLARGL